MATPAMMRQDRNRGLQAPARMVPGPVTPGAGDNMAAPLQDGGMVPVQSGEYILPVDAVIGMGMKAAPNSKLSKVDAYAIGKLLIDQQVTGLKAAAGNPVPPKNAGLAGPGMMGGEGYAQGGAVDEEERRKLLAATTVATPTFDQFQQATGSLAIPAASLSGPKGVPAVDPRAGSLILAKDAPFKTFDDVVNFRGIGQTPGNYSSKTASQQQATASSGVATPRPRTVPGPMTDSQSQGITDRVAAEPARTPIPTTFPTTATSPVPDPRSPVPASGLAWNAEPPPGSGYIQMGPQRATLDGGKINANGLQLNPVNLQQPAVNLKADGSDYVTQREQDATQSKGLAGMTQLAKPDYNKVRDQYQAANGLVWSDPRLQKGADEQYKQAMTDFTALSGNVNNNITGQQQNAVTAQGHGLTYQAAMAKTGVEAREVANKGPMWAGEGKYKAAAGLKMEADAEAVRNANTPEARAAAAKAEKANPQVLSELNRVMKEADSNRKSLLKEHAARSTAYNQMVAGMSKKDWQKDPTTQEEYRALLDLNTQIQQHLDAYSAAEQEKNGLLGRTVAQPTPGRSTPSKPLSDFDA